MTDLQPRTRRTQGEGSADIRDAVDPWAMRSSDVARLVEALVRARNGDLSAKLPWRSGPLGDIAEHLNALLGQHARFHRDVSRLGTKVGRDGRPDARLEVPLDAPLLAASATA